MPTLALALTMLALEQATTARREQAATHAAARGRGAAHGGGDAAPARAGGTVRPTLPTAAGS
ncbi:MAG TPA: hypothetical protein VGQ58_00020 [Candidatus Limnocylindrales bacterium]|jgi:hypothetical protein|nr:hypothetical protein [Candidatus Limnocylindrales bacterium]